MRQTLIATLAVLLAATTALAGAAAPGGQEGGSTLTEQQRLKIQAIYQQACEDAAQAQTAEQKRKIWRKMLQDIDQVGGEPIQDRTRLQEGARDRTRLLDCDNDCETRRERVGGDEPPAGDCDGDQIRQRDRDRDCWEDPEDPAETIAALAGSAMMLDTLVMSPEQAGAVEQICKETADRLRERIRLVLTDEQKGELEIIRQQLRAMDGILGDECGLCDNKLKLRILASLELTEDQLAVILDAVEAARILLAEAETPEERRQIIADTRAVILSVLTEEQLALLEEIMQQVRQQKQQRSRRDGGEELMVRMMNQLGLSEQQQSLVDDILSAAEEGAEDAETPAEQRKIREQTREQIMNVLTEQQQEQLQQTLRTAARQRAQERDLARICQQLELTEEQQALLQQICEQTRARLEAAETPQQKRQIMQQARQQVTEMLTDEQIQQLEQLRQRTRERDCDPPQDGSGTGTGGTGTGGSGSGGSTNG